MRNKLKPKRQHRAELFTLSLLCLALTACGGDDFTDLDQKIDEIKGTPKGQIAPLTPPKTPEPFAFELDASRDPFQQKDKEETAQIDEVEADNGVKPDPTRVKEDLESHALDTLKMVGTLKDSAGGMVGLVLSSDGTVYRVRVGNYMGLNDGIITEISNTKITLKEIVPDKNFDKEKPRYSYQSASLDLPTN